MHPDIWHVLHGVPSILRLMGAGLRRPAHPVPGTDMAGTVEAVGEAVTRFHPGDEVFGETVKGYQWRNGGAFAEYVAAPVSALERKPSASASRRPRRSRPRGSSPGRDCTCGATVVPGDNVLVNGAAGGVGTVAVQLARGPAPV